MSERPRPTVFLDRDGVLNRRLMGWVTHVKTLVVLPGVPEAVAALNRDGFRCVVVTNQRGIALGKMTLLDVTIVNARLEDQIRKGGGRIDGFYVCPHDRDDGCACRKPKPGLLDQAAADEPVDWRASFLVGDSDSDIQAGLERAVTCIKIGKPSQPRARTHVNNLGEAVAWILKQKCKF